ncbi:MAG TPA: hypothetical protein VMC08_01045 [Bacteroidales bacterium]|nr:hypothetical protein [Bacteroidales bacterium]
MIGKKLLSFLVTLVSALLLLVQASCEKFSGDQTIPAYLRIDSIFLTTDYIYQGTASQAITDSWVYVDDELIGVFENPCDVPVLKQGTHKVVVYAGIKKNGIATTRTAYLFYEPITRNVNFVPDSTVSLHTLSTTYEATTDFLWKEDFEDIAVSLDTTPKSLVPLQETPIGSPLTFEGQHSGLATMTDSLDFFECATHSFFAVPNSPVYLEMNFRTNNSLTVGVYVVQSTFLYQVPIITLFPTNGKWKKIYIDLSNTLGSYLGATGFKVYLGTYKDAGVASPEILLDNFKLVTQSSSKKNL